jgi:hypothetical protein
VVVRLLRQSIPVMPINEHGVGVKPEQDGITGSTFNSHRLVAWAGAEHGAAVQNRLIDALFRGYFTEVSPSNSPHPLTYFWSHFMCLNACRLDCPLKNIIPPQRAGSLSSEQHTPCHHLQQVAFCLNVIQDRSTYMRSVYEWY